MISGSPLSGTPISAALTAASGGNQSLTPTGPAIFTWTVPNQTLVQSGGPQTLVPTGPAIFTWVAPDQTLVQTGTTIWNRRMTEAPDRVGSRSSNAREVGL